MPTLLYVDDEEALTRFVLRYFEQRGDTVLTASNLSEARELLSTHDPLVIFVDFWIGRESGLELLDWIRANRPHLTDRVTFVTGELINDDNIRRIRAEIGLPFIQKPFEMVALVQAVERAESRVGT